MNKEQRVGYTVELSGLNAEMLQELLTWVEKTWGGVDSGDTVIRPTIVSDVQYGTIPFTGRWIRDTSRPEDPKNG